ncbi:MAG: G-D-S-L family lipolytic protein [Bergeyella sp.]|nr:G-D-S-L family lipolytic protein [Bergeyella sp.]
MKKLRTNTLDILLVSALLLAGGCSADFKEATGTEVVSSGSANFGTYVALGNSLTSGYRDGALYRDGQKESFPSILSAQMKKAGGGEFRQPMSTDNTGGFKNLYNPKTGDFAGKLVLKVNKNGKLAPIPMLPESSLDNIASQGPYQNLGIPGAKSFHLGIPKYGDLNPYYSRFSTGKSIIEAAISQSPTFFSLWIGNNDVLSYAASGGIGKDQTGNYNPSSYGENDITDPTVFKKVVNQYLKALTASGAKGVIANIPSVLHIPFFATVPYNAIELNENVANVLNQSLYAPVKKILAVLGQGDRISWAQKGKNPILIFDKDLTNLQPQITSALSSSGVPASQARMIGEFFAQARHAKKTDLILLKASQILGKNPGQYPAPFDKVGVTTPLADRYALTSAETKKVEAATRAYNETITALANAYGLALVDTKSKMSELITNSGIQWDGVKYSSKYLTGGAFSLDGIHLTGRGNAIVANEFIQSINRKYGARLPLVNVNRYSGIKFP